MRQFTFLKIDNRIYVRLLERMKVFWPLDYSAIQKSKVQPERVSEIINVLTAWAVVTIEKVFKFWTEPPHKDVPFLGDQRSDQSRTQ